MNDRVEGSSNAVWDRATSAWRRAIEWVLLKGDRLLVAAIINAALGAFFFAAEQVGWFPLRDPGPMLYVFGSLIGGNLTLVTVVISINQLLLSRELRSPGELETQIENVIDYRRGVEDTAGRIAPVTPLGFLRLIFENTRQEAQRVGGIARYVERGESEMQERVDDLVSEMTAHFDELLGILEGSDTGIFGVLAVTLDTNYAGQINHIRQLRAEYEEGLSEETLDALENLIESLQKVDVARQYFKSLYLQDELSELSRILLYTGIPAEVVAISTLFVLTAGGGLQQIRYVRFLLPAAVTIGLIPLSVLFAFVVRTATVTQRTAATIPFTTPEQEK